MHAVSYLVVLLYAVNQVQSANPDCLPNTVDTRNIHLRTSCLKNESKSSHPLKVAKSLTDLVNDLNRVVTNQSLSRTQLVQSVSTLTKMKDIYTTLADRTRLGFSSNELDWLGLFRNVSRLVDGILDPRNKQILIGSKMITMIDVMDKVAKIAADKTFLSSLGTEARLIYPGTNMAIDIVKYRPADFQDFVRSISTRQATETTNQDSVILPREAIATQLINTDDVSVVIKVYKDVKGFFHRQVNSSISDEQTTQDMSHLVTITILINSKNIMVLSAPIIINFALQSPKLRESTPHCVYWNKSSNAWKNDSVNFVSANKTHIQCSTNHLTSFAVLFSSSNTEIPAHHALALDLLTYICCGLSIAVLFVTLIIFYSIEALSSDRHRIHMHLALSILLSQLLFLIGIDATAHQALCGIVAGVLHYLFLSSFSWMCVEGFHLYMKIVRVYRTESMRMLYYYIFGWGFPVIYVVLAASINASGYGTESACWLSLKNGFIWVFIGPVAIITLINLIILVMVIKVVITAADMMETQRAKIMTGVKGISMLLPLLGVTWVFGLLIVDNTSIVFHYIFTVTNSLQGFFIFTFHCVGNREVRRALRRFGERTLFDFNSVFPPSSGDVTSTESRKSQKDRKSKEKVEKTKVHQLKKI